MVSRSSLIVAPSSAVMAAMRSGESRSDRKVRRPWVLGPAANSRWITRSCRSRAIRSRSRKTASCSRRRWTRSSSRARETCGVNERTISWSTSTKGGNSAGRPSRRNRGSPATESRVHRAVEMVVGVPGSRWARSSRVSRSGADGDSRASSRRCGPTSRRTSATAAARAPSNCSSVPVNAPVPFFPVRRSSPRTIPRVRRGTERKEVGPSSTGCPTVIR